MCIVSSESAASAVSSAVKKILFFAKKKTKQNKEKFIIYAKDKSTLLQCHKIETNQTKNVIKLYLVNSHTR